MRILKMCDDSMILKQPFLPDSMIENAHPIIIGVAPFGKYPCKHGCSPQGNAQTAASFKAAV